MASKKLEVSINSGQTEVTKNAIIAAANVQKGAAEVVRDGNGKVVKVIIKLPESASAAAIAALEATSGVSDVQVSDLPIGTTGLDGSEAQVDSLVDQGYLVTSFNTMTIVYNADGTTTYTSADGNNARYGYTKTDAMVVAPLPFVVEIRAKMPIGATDGNDFVGFDFNNHTYSGNLVAHFGGTKSVVEDNVGNNFVNTTVAGNDGQFHNWKWSMDGSGLLTSYFDGAQIATQQFTASGPDLGNYAHIHTGSLDSSQSVIVDFARWTAA